MGFEMLWNEKDIEYISREFSSQVSKHLEKVLTDKKRQIKWKDSMAELRRRFQDIISLDGLTVR